MSTLNVKDGNGFSKFLAMFGLGTSASPLFPINAHFLIEVAKGNVPGHSLIHKFGRNPGVPNGTFEFVTSLGQTNHVLSALTTVRIKAGGNAADTAAGAGAREITIQGIDSTLAEVTETITTAGAGASAVTTKTWWRVHRAWVSSVGTYGAANTGAITIENGAGGTDIILIETEQGQTQDAVWTVPIGKTAYLLSSVTTIDSSQDADIQIFQRQDITDTTAPMKSRRIINHFDGLAATFGFKPNFPSFALPALTDIWAEAEGSGGNTMVSVDLEILVIDD